MKRHLAAAGFGLVRVGRLAGEVGAHHEDAGRDARAVEEIGRQADDGLDEVLFEELLADLLFRAAAKEHAVGMTVATMPPGLQTASMCWANMRSPFLPGRRTPAPAEALRELHVAARVVLAEGRIGDDAVEALQFAGLAVHGWSSVSCSWMSAPGTPCSSMLSLQMDHAEASFTWPQRRRLVGSPPDCSMNSRLMMSMPPEPQVGS